MSASEFETLDRILKHHEEELIEEAFADLPTFKEDRLGLDAVYIQAKRWENPVGRPMVQQFSGSLDQHKATKAVLITTSSFTADAREYVRSIGKRIVLVDGIQLADLLIDNEVGVLTEASYKLVRVDHGFFDPE